MDYGVLLSAFRVDYERSTGRPPSMRMSRQHMLYACLRAAILDGRIRSGARLLASRALAAELGMARNSVLYAYERLVAEGFVVSSAQGTVVANLAQPPHAAPGGAGAAVLSHRAEHIAWPEDGMDNVLPFVPGTPALDAFPLQQWRRCVERAWRHAGPDQLGYMSVAGNAPLRRAIAGYLRVSRGLRCEAEQILITDGSQGGLDLCARSLADAGDTAWIENPGYHGARAAFQLAGLRLRPIPVDADGLAPQPHDWRDAPPKLIYITPTHQYPLGAVMSLERRLALLALARAAGAWIIEDDYDSEFRHPDMPLSALQGLSEDAPVIYLGTFSKSMFPALRLGFIVVPVLLAGVLGRAANTLTLRGRTAEQLALADFMEAGHYTRHLRRMRRLYHERRSALQDALARHANDLLTVSAGVGGMQLSARIDVAVADTELSRAARGQGLVLRPLSRLCLPGTEDGYNGLLLGYGAVPAQRMDALVRRLRRTVVSTLGAPGGT
jgi:GntR family transcriptional regulator/MocR family aminotransferase